MIGDWLLSFFRCIDQQLQPCGEAHDITTDGDSAVASFPILCVVWVNVELCVGLQQILGYQEGNGWAVGGHSDILQPQLPHIEASEA